MGEHMLNALLERLNEMKAEYQGRDDELTRKQIATEVFDVMKRYTVDRREILGLFGLQELSVNDIRAMKELDYE